jgi:DNA repair protein RadC
MKYPRAADGTGSVRLTSLDQVVARYRLSLVREPNPHYQDPQRCDSPEVAVQAIRPLVENEPYEVMGAMMLDTRHRAIGYEIAYRGTLNRAAVEPRGLLVPALLTNASGLIAFHNHPSGDPSPSAEDLAFTRRLAEAGEIVGVRLLDHLIIGEAPKYTSLRQRGSF